MDNSSKSMMGTAQRTWFRQELINSSRTHNMVFWVSTVPWTAPPTAGADHWGGFTYEGQIIADAIKSNTIGNLVIISGDAHCLGANNGMNAAYATGGGGSAPEILAAPLDGDDTSVKGGPWSEGTWQSSKGTNAYGLVTVRSTSDSIYISFIGRNNSHEEKLSLTYSIRRTSATIQVERHHIRQGVRGGKAKRTKQLKQRPAIRIKRGDSNRPRSRARQLIERGGSRKMMYWRSRGFRRKAISSSPQRDSYCD